MLRKETIAASTLELLKELMQDEHLKDFFLVGGTALSLRIGHRTSMKLNSIVGNGTRVKDFIDIAFLSSFLSLDQMLDAYEAKYKTRNAIIVLKSLDFHQDINHLELIKLVTENYYWKPIEQRIKRMLSAHDQIFEPMDEVLKLEQKKIIKKNFERKP